MNLSSSIENSYRVAVLGWFPEEDGFVNVICDELTALGHRPEILRYDVTIPKSFDVVFTFAPYGPLLPIYYHLAELPVEDRPIAVHWNTEGIPDLRIPWLAVSTLAALRSWFGRLAYTSSVAYKLAKPWETRVLRYRYVGDYHYAYRKGWLNVFADTSAIYAQIHSQHGLPTIVAPFGGTARWHDDLGLERDIDVLWMGQRGSKRRSRILDSLREELRAHGVEMYMADNVEKPFIFGKERTQILNRVKITLNLTRTWYDENLMRFAIAAPNRTMIISEPLLAHYPEVIPETHYISAPIDKLADAIIYYLNNHDERIRIVENAYDLSTTVLTFNNSLSAIMGGVDQYVACGVGRG